MSATLQSQVIQLANQINGLAGQLQNISSQVAVLNTQWNALNGQSVLNAMGTVAQNTDGSPGAADASPTSGHPISATLYPSLSRATSAYNYGATLTLLQQLLNLLTGQAVATQATAPTLLAEMSGG